MTPTDQPFNMADRDEMQTAIDGARVSGDVDHVIPWIGRLVAEVQRIATERDDALARLAAKPTTSAPTPKPSANEDYAPTPELLRDAVGDVLAEVPVMSDSTVAEFRAMVAGIAQGILSRLAPDVP